MDSGETNSESNLLSSGTDDAMNDADEADTAEELSQPSLSMVHRLHLHILLVIKAMLGQRYVR